MGDLLSSPIKSVEDMESLGHSFVEGVWKADQVLGGQTRQVGFSPCGGGFSGNSRGILSSAVEEGSINQPTLMGPGGPCAGLTGLGLFPRRGRLLGNSGGMLSSAVEEGRISQPMLRRPGEPCAVPVGLMVPYDSSAIADGPTGFGTSYSVPYQKREVGAGLSLPPATDRSLSDPCARPATLPTLVPFAEGWGGDINNRPGQSTIGAVSPHFIRPTVVQPNSGRTPPSRPPMESPSPDPHPSLADSGVPWDLPSWTSSAHPDAGCGIPRGSSTRGCGEITDGGSPRLIHMHVPRPLSFPSLKNCISVDLQATENFGVSLVADACHSDGTDSLSEDGESKTTVSGSFKSLASAPDPDIPPSRPAESSSSTSVDPSTSQTSFSIEETPPFLSIQIHPRASSTSMGMDGKRNRPPPCPELSGLPSFDPKPPIPFPEPVVPSPQIPTVFGTDGTSSQDPVIPSSQPPILSGTDGRSPVHTGFPSSPSLVLFGTDRKDSRDVGVSSSQVSVPLRTGGHVPRVRRVPRTPPPYLSPDHQSSLVEIGVPGASSSPPSTKHRSPIPSRDYNTTSSRTSKIFGPSQSRPLDRYRIPPLKNNVFTPSADPCQAVADNVPLPDQVFFRTAGSRQCPSIPGPFQSSSCVLDPGSSSFTSRGPRPFVDSSISQTSFYIEETVPFLWIRVQTREPANFVEPDAERNRPLSHPRPSGMQTHTAENIPPILSPSPLLQSEQLGVMLSKDDVASSKDASAKDSIITVPLSTSPKTNAMYQLGLVGHSWTGDTHLSSLPSTPTSSFSDWNSIGISGDAHGQRTDSEYVAETLFPAETGSVPETVSISVPSDTIGEEQPGTAPHAPLPPVASQIMICASSEASCITPRLESVSHPAMESRNTAAVWSVGCEVVGEKEPPDRAHPPITTPPGSAPWRKGCAPRKTSFGMLYKNSTPGSSIPASQSPTPLASSVYAISDQIRSGGTDLGMNCPTTPSGSQKPRVPSPLLPMLFGVDSKDPRDFEVSSSPSTTLSGMADSRFPSSRYPFAGT